MQEMVRVRYKPWVYVTALVISILLFILVYFISQFNWGQYAWLYILNIAALPNQGDINVGKRSLDGDGWVPGEPDWLVDLTELQYTVPAKSLKSNTERAIGYHKLLLYNTYPTDMLPHENTLFNSCPYTNCHITKDREDFNESSAVIFSMSHTEMGLPPSRRPNDQIWVFYDNEPPLVSREVFHRHRSWNGKFNWSMTYRLDSDIIKTYGYLRTRALDKIPKINYHKAFTRKTKFAAWFVSNCKLSSRSARNEYVQELRKFVPVDIYGRCGTRVADMSDESVKQILANYKFYLSFENSFCLDYLTEKYFYYFNITDTVLVVRGGANYDQLLPKYTFINTEHFTSPKKLAIYLLALNQSEHEYTKYLKTRDKYEVVTMNWACNMCIKLNNNPKYANVYSDLVGWWHIDTCWAAADINIDWTPRKQWTLIFLFSLCVCIFVVLRMWKRGQLVCYCCKKLVNFKMAFKIGVK